MIWDSSPFSVLFTYTYLAYICCVDERAAYTVFKVVATVFYLYTHTHTHTRSLTIAYTYVHTHQQHTYTLKEAKKTHSHDTMRSLDLESDGPILS